MDIEGLTTSDLYFEKTSSFALWRVNRRELRDGGGQLSKVVILCLKTSGLQIAVVRAGISTFIITLNLDSKLSL
jgi:hypothetical protein